MWAPKLPGEGAAIYDAAQAMRDAMIAVGIAVDGGKDSLSMATMVDGQTVKSPRELVISAYAAMPDITKVITPDIKEPGSILLLLDFSDEKNRLGGTAIAQVLGRLGDDCPDMDNPELVKRSFLAVQEIIGKGLVLAGHDRSDGGLIVTLLEMAFSGNCGLKITMQGWDSALAVLFSEELGLVLECRKDTIEEVKNILEFAGVPYLIIGRASVEKRIKVVYDDELVLDEEMELLRQWWEETSYQLERLQMNPDCADEEKKNIAHRTGPTYFLPFHPEPASRELHSRSEKPKIAILRDEGSNSDREMSSAFYSAGFEPWDICMTDLLAGKIDLARFRGLAAVGGFSYGDVPESAKGWASTILFNDKLKVMFDEFYNRPDTFTLGICNGCQLFGLLGWVPWQGLSAESQPRFIRNISARFESRWTTVKVLKTNAVMLKGMEDLVFGIHVDHGEGRLYFPDAAVKEKVLAGNMVPVVFVDDNSESTEAYPFNPNGSPGGLAGLCSPDGRHLAMMPHPERTFLSWQAHYLPTAMKKLQVTPWMQMFRNAYDWCCDK
jgi:phosphoribosylformylglycinamidine synthase